MSPDRHGSGATRIEADLSIKRGENLMRRASTCLAVLGLALLALPSVASAAPKVVLTAEAVPIPKPGGGSWPHTGNIYGAGAAVQAEYTIKGTEYGGEFSGEGHPDPLIGVTFFLPKGTKLHSQGFKTCPLKTLEVEKAPEKCPKGSAASPINSQGEASGRSWGVVSFGHTAVPEEVEVFSFFVPNGLEFMIFGHSPATFEEPSPGHYVNLNGAGGFGPELITKVPLIETVEGAPYASTEKIKITVGAAYKQGKKLISYGTVPKKGQCPKAGFLVKSELTFAEHGNVSDPVTVRAEYRAPCPRK